jgi:predicted nucleotidyltransferase
MAMKRIRDLRDRRELVKLDPNLTIIADAVMRTFPATKAILFYGSQVQGQPDGYSDYDVLAILPSSEVPDLWERAEIERELRERHGLRVHFSATSPETAWLELRMAPYLRHWLEQGVLLGDGDVFQEPFPPLAKEGARVTLGSIENDLDLMIEQGDSRRWRAEVLMRALRSLILLRTAIWGRYPCDLRGEVETEVGAAIVKRLRNPKGRIRPDDLERLERRVKELLRQVKELAAAMPENASDREVRQLRLYAKDAA